VKLGGKRGGAMTAEFVGTLAENIAPSRAAILFNCSEGHVRLCTQKMTEMIFNAKKGPFESMKMIPTTRSKITHEEKVHMM
jgi:hypothetical protein